MTALHVHVSGSAGTSFCAFAKQYTRNASHTRAPPYNCELPGKKHGNWGSLLPGKRDTSEALTCGGLHTLADSGEHRE